MHSYWTGELVSSALTRGTRHVCGTLEDPFIIVGGSNLGKRKQMEFSDFLEVFDLYLEIHCYLT